MNWVFFLIILIAYFTSAWHQWQWQTNPVTPDSPMHALTQQLLHATTDAVTLAIGLVGVLCLFLGLMRILEEGGFVSILGKLIYPLLKPLFPEIPANHPAFGAMIMNLSANVLGMGNAATPFGLKAMQELDKLNPHPGTATNAMVLFLALNTACITLIPTKVIALRASAGSHDAAGIVTTTLIATLCSTAMAILCAKLLQRFTRTPKATLSTIPQTESTAPIASYPTWVSLLALVGIIALVPVTLIWGRVFSPWIIPSFIVVIFTYGLLKRLDIYATFIEGAKGGFELAIKILPYIVAMLFAIAMLRASGALGIITHAIAPFTAPLGIPAEALPMVFMRPLSGSGSLGILTDILNNPALGPDSYAGYLVSTMMGSTETTFYVLAVYFGAVQIRRIRHALATGLLVELAGMAASVIAVKVLLFS
ncbi:MAG: nucleoside recognition domain-containing protein [Candidatus Berkiella sp.]